MATTPFRLFSRSTTRQIVGGDGRFSIVGGFTPETVGAVAAEFDIAFDSGTAEWDSLYTATLTFSTRDESGVPGAPISTTSS